VRAAVLDEDLTVREWDSRNLLPVPEALGDELAAVATVAQLVGRLVGQAEQIIEQRLAGLTGRPGSACR